MKNAYEQTRDKSDEFSAQQSVLTDNDYNQGKSRGQRFSPDHGLNPSLQALSELLYNHSATSDPYGSDPFQDVDDDSNLISQ